VIFFVAVALAFLAAAAMGGDVRRLGRLQVRAWGLLLVAFALKGGLILLAARHVYEVLPYSGIVNIAVLLLLLAGAVVNRGLPGAGLFMVGFALNLLVIAAFGGHMPVLVPEYAHNAGRAVADLGSGRDPVHTLLTERRGLWFLGDVIYLPALGRASLVSVGDCFLAAGIVWLVLRASRSASGGVRTAE
jgi:hypothetical protein